MLHLNEHSIAEQSIIVVKDALALTDAALGRLVKSLEGAEGDAAVCLTGGSTPKRMYESMGRPPWRERIPWHRVHWFMGDDRFVPLADPLSNGGMARRAFLDECAPPDHVHLIDTELASPDQSAARYEQELRAFNERRGAAPLFDMVLLGVGPDGHTASLFPGFSELHETACWCVGVSRANVAPFVPRVTLTLPCLSLTREMLFMSAGLDKRAILARIFSGEDLPAARAHAANGETVWIVDEAASLKVT